MKRLLLVAVALGCAVAASRADWGGPGAPKGGMQLPQIGGPNTLIGAGGPANGVSPDPYGMHPRLKRLFRISDKPSTYYPQMGYGQNGPAYNPTGYPQGAYGPAQGTLVFPHHPYTRSPRDFFMLDLNK